MNYVHTNQPEVNSSDYIQKNGSKTKSISSKQFFGEEESREAEIERKARLAKFEGSK